MIRRVVNEIRRQYLGAIALFLVVAGGTSYAAVHLSAGSVGTRQLRNHAVTNRKLAKGAVGVRDLDPKTIGGSVRAWAVVDSTGKVRAGSRRAHVIKDPNLPGSYVVEWGARFPAPCATTASIDGAYSAVTETIPITVGGIPGSQGVTAGYVSGVSSNSPRASKHSGTRLITFNQAGQPTPLGFDVAVIC